MEEKENLEKLKDRLYRQREKFSERQRKKKFRLDLGEDLTSEWTETSDPEYIFEETVGKKRFRIPYMKTIFSIAIIIFIISLVVLVYFWSRGTQFISAKNINIEVRGPVHINGGEMALLDIYVENRNESVLEIADLVIGYPEGTLSPKGDSITRTVEPLGRIGANSSVKKSISFILLGREDEEKNLNISLEYRLEGSNAVFIKNTKQILKITRPPVGLSVAITKEISAKQEMRIDIEAVSNAELVLKNLALKVYYPSGFQFLRADPVPKKNNNMWELGDMNITQKKDFSIYGFIEGIDLEEKAFRAEVGSTNYKGDFIPYGVAAETVTVKKPDLDLVIFLNGEDKKENFAFSGNNIRGEVAWINNSPASIRNATIELRIRGKALNERTISISGGYYRSSDKTLIWNAQSFSSLALIEPGGTGSVKFNFSILEPLPINNQNDKNFVITLNSHIAGKIAMEDSGETDIQNDTDKEIKISSFLQLASYGLYYSGPFKNTGPIPPRVDKETTYTIIWSLGNTSNDFSGVKISAFLPPYVKFINNISPNGEDVSYEENDGRIVWNTGAISAGTGIIQPAKEVAFQISFLPNATQIDTTPVLVANILLEGKDNFTGNTIVETKQPLDTFLKNDPKFNYNYSRVMP
ncbi:MAG: hypothetical protein AB1643_02200 [Patescibacteria group bacterium]